VTHPHYDHYSPTTIARLDGLYGEVDQRMNERIRRLVIGPDVLDLGCGYGSLVEQLRQAGLNTVGIDLLDDHIEAGRRRFPNAQLRVVEPGPLPFPDSSFDTVVLKESLHHLAAEADIDESIAEVARVCRQRVVVFEPNPSFLLKIGRTLIRHLDPQCPPDLARHFLERGGHFKVRGITFSEAIAFPLSSGYVARPLAPPSAAQLLFALDTS
jgi:ubiquinone/menaquinone biosynthesis C-methylase UbiE